MKNLTCRIVGIGRGLWLAASLTTITSISAFAQVNSWIAPSSGNWDEPTNWSAGVLPNSSQSVLITNSAWKAVAINPSTPVNSPESMTVSNLTVRGSTNTENVLLLNFAGTAVPLTVINGLTLQDNGQLQDFSSGLLVEGGTITVTNSQIVQDGGFIISTNAQMYLNDSTYNLTNGDFEGGSVLLGDPVSAHFNQYGGTVTILNLELGSFIFGTVQNGYSLYGGTLNLPGGLYLFGESGGVGYFQAGGTNRTTQVTVEPDYGGYVSAFTLNGGLLADSDVKLMAGYKTPMSIEQNGGSHVTTNTLFIAGSSANGFSTDPATYNLNGGTLSAGMIELDADDGDAVFVQSNATTSVETFYAHSVGYYSSHNTIVDLSRGTLSCSNYVTDDGHGQLNQSGGALNVSNLLAFTGSRDVGAPYLIYGTYAFTGGTLEAGNIDMGGDWIIGDGTTNRISNPGFFRLSHMLQMSNAVEQLGRFILASNATIDLAGTSSRLSFANSGTETWAAGAALVITDWNGNPSGGGAERLTFGSDASGLTTAQLSQIQFLVSTNVYGAKILDTGEVVPNLANGPNVGFSQQGNNLVLTWPAGWTLQSATNIWGPYFDIPSATSPFTNDTTSSPQEFFRLRQ